MFEKLNNKERCYIIAEIGGNFITYEEALKLIDSAHYAGVDCVKLQTYTAETISSKGAFFDMEGTGKISQYEYFKKYELSEELHRKIFDYIGQLGMDWFSTPSHQDDVDLLIKLGVQAIKIGADDANNLPFLRYIARTGLFTVLSTGMSTLEEIKEAVNVFLEEGNSTLAILHTVSGYPTHPHEVNLNVINTFKNNFPEFHIGFSDHTLTPITCIAAATMGASIVERHFTLDKNAEGPDHIISSTPDEMKYIVDSIRTIEKMKGSGIKMPFGSELKNRLNNRKSIVAKKDINKGELLNVDNLCVKRPGTGIQPKYLEQIIGKSVKTTLKEDDVLNWNDLE